MPRILVVDDRPLNRELLRTILSYKGHEILEACDGFQALALAKSEHPHLVISDILMPTMDGYEFVRNLRNDPATASIPVVFNTAHYLDREAHALAKACGVSHLLYKPNEPEAVLQIVEAALAPAPVVLPSVVQEGFDREHLRLLTDKLSQKADSLRAVNERLAALIDCNRKMVTERDPLRLLENCCDSARRLIGAKYAVIALLDEKTKCFGRMFISGMTEELVSKIGPHPIGEGPLADLLKDGGSLREAGADLDAEALGLALSFPAARSFLGVAIASSTRVFGLLLLADKTGLDEFWEDDEKLAAMLAGQMAVAFENSERFSEIQRQAVELKQEIAERKRAEVLVNESLKEKEVLLKEIHHRVKNNLQIISSLLKMQARYISDSHALEIFKDSQNRVKSMAIIHEQLYQSKNLAEINFDEYVQSLVSELMDSYGVSPRSITTRIDIKGISFDIDNAIPCGLIINELVSNSFKYAFQSSSNGQLEIALRSTDEGRFVLIVKDNGVGLPADLDFRNTTSLGLRLVNSLASQLRGSIELSANAGTEFRITFSGVKYKERG